MNDAGGPQWTIHDQQGQVAEWATPGDALAQAMQWAVTAGPATIVTPSGVRFEVLWMGPTAVPDRATHVVTTESLAALPSSSQSALSSLPAPPSLKTSPGGSVNP